MMESILLIMQKRAIAFYLLLASLLVYLWVNWEAIVIYAVLLFIDTITWFTKAWMLKKWPTSARFYYGIVSKLWLLSIPLVVAIALKWLWLDNASWITTSMVLWLFILGETYSIIQNIFSTYMGKEVMEYDATKEIISFVLNTIKSAIKRGNQ